MSRAVVLLLVFYAIFGVAQSKAPRAKSAPKPANTPAQAKTELGRGTAQSRVADAEKVLRTIEQDWLTALDKRDAAAVDALLAPDFRDLGVDGLVHTRQQVLALVTDPTRPALQRMIGRLDIRLYGAQFAVATGLTLVSGENIREAHIAFTHVSVLREGKWQVVSSQETLSIE
jgi:hypothetical protein